MRVVAIMSATEDKVFSFGEGEYVGDEVPPSDGAGVLGILSQMNVPNPKIVLDSGKVVWGCECWWGTPERMVDIFEGREVVVVDIDTERSKAYSEEVAE